MARFESKTGMYGQWRKAALTALCLGWTVVGAVAQTTAPDATETGAIAPVNNGATPAAGSGLPNVTTSPVPLPGATNTAATPVPATEATVPAGDSAAAPAGAAPDGTPPQTEAAAAPLPAACFMPPARLAEAEIDDFLADPAKLLQGFYGQDDVTLGNRVRALSASDARTLEPILTTLLSSANPQQKSAIGAGLGRAAFSCQRSSPELAALIQSRVADLNAGEVLTAFLSATRDFQVAAFGAGGGGGVSAASGLTGTGSPGGDSAGLGGDDTVAQTITNYDVGNSSYARQSLLSVSGSSR